MNHFRRIIVKTQPSVDCLFAGNVSAKEASDFFFAAKSQIEEAIKKADGDPDAEACIPASSLERQVAPGNEIQLHFASENPAEVNGAVLWTYQSSIPCFRGDGISHSSQLHSSSSIRLICHMLREPLFTELRLGYFVNSYYEIGYSSKSNEDHTAPKTTPVDFIMINVMSKKLAPPDILDRIDDFLDVFRQRLTRVPA